jgi:AcrR family transcriptional regulator
MRPKKSTTTPQQNRSKLSLEKILRSTIVLLERRGHQDFTLLEVCEHAGLTVGAIYSRFSSKEALLRAVQLKIIEQLDIETERMVAILGAETIPLRDLARNTVREFASILRVHDRVLRAMMARASQDPVMGKAGQALDRRMASRFRQTLLKCRSEITHESPERAVNTCFDVVFASTTRFLGLGTAPDVHGHGNWDLYIEDLGAMTANFLTGPSAWQSKTRPNTKIIAKPQGTRRTNDAHRSG